jgi:hypothetical protein
VKLEHHVVASTVLSGAAYAATRSWPLTLASFYWGVFIDLDHFIDYYATFGLRATPLGVFDASHNGKLRRVTLVFHGWEWVVLLAAATWWSGWNPWVAGVTLGMGQHLVFDQFANRPHPFGYFFFWRLRHGFDMRTAFPDHKEGTTP